MKKCLRFEMMRALESRGLKVSLSIGIALGLLDGVAFYDQYGASREKILIQAWIGTDFQFAYNSLFYILLPILACLPYAGSFYQDIRSGYIKNICTRVPRWKYLLAKNMVSFICAFVCTTIPLTANLFLMAGLYPNHLPEKLNFLSAGIIDCYRFSMEFNRLPLIYCFIFILIDGIFAGVISLISVILARYCNSLFSVVVSPFVLYILTGVGMWKEDGSSLAIMEMVNPVQRYLSTTEEMLLTYFFLLFAVLGIIWLQERKKDIL